MERLLLKESCRRDGRLTELRRGRWRRIRDGWFAPFGGGFIGGLAKGLSNSIVELFEDEFGVSRIIFERDFLKGDSQCCREIVSLLKRNPPFLVFIRFIRN